ncbi:MAG: transcription elongation factor GreA [Jatrophihabitans sp.]
MAEATTWLTQEAYDRLSAQLEDLIEGRPAMAAEINARREEGDLKENGGYHAAREEQAKQEGRIVQLQEMLRVAKIGHPPIAEGTAGTGTVVTVRYEGDDDTETFLLGSREEAGTTDLTVYSPKSPLGAALDGAKEGETVSYEAPSGSTIKLTLLNAVPFTG